MAQGGAEHPADPVGADPGHRHGHRAVARQWSEVAVEPGAGQDPVGGVAVQVVMLGRHLEVGDRLGHGMGPVHRDAVGQLTARMGDELPADHALVGERLAERGRRTVDAPEPRAAAHSGLEPRLLGRRQMALGPDRDDDVVAAPSRSGTWKSGPPGRSRARRGRAPQGRRGPAGAEPEPRVGRACERAQLWTGETPRPAPVDGQRRRSRPARPVQVGCPGRPDLEPPCPGRRPRAGPSGARSAGCGRRPSGAAEPRSRKCLGRRRTLDTHRWSTQAVIVHSSTQGRLKDSVAVVSSTKRERTCIADSHRPWWGR